MRTIAYEPVNTSTLFNAHAGLRARVWLQQEQLGFTGAGGERTDVLAHLTGFATGALSGVAHAAWRCPRGAPAQLVAGLGALLALTAAWWFALR